MSYLKQYEYVISVAKFKSISQAAESLGISQPTFSKYLKKIESSLGVELFDRSTVPLKLTRAGEHYVEAGKRFIDLDRQLKKELEEIKSDRGSVIRVGISPSRSPYMMPVIISRFMEKRPSGRVIIEERTTKELSKRLTEGELDIVISLLDEETQKFERIELFNESIMLAVSKSVSKESDTARDVFAKHTLINVGKGQVMWQIMRDITEEMGIPEAQIECQSIESALALVKKGIGAMLVPSYIVSENNQSIRFLPLLTEEEKERKVCIFYRKEQFLTQAEKDFIDCVKEKEV